MLLSLSQHQCANCAKTTTLAPADIQVHELDQLILVLPACQCGAVEYLRICTVDENPGEHAELVRQLAKAREES